MAGFLPFADTEELRGEINSQLETMFRSVIMILYVTNVERNDSIVRTSAPIPSPWPLGGSTRFSGGAVPGQDILLIIILII